ncbi:hypothetical protein OHA37_26895 [Streptomyces sp. NBC_00335]|uniref:hypothetical protein n=1 Tax=unclassified Streptomyces TaxID=2593676 RepID=UPI0022583DCD|nr:MULTISPECIES: hypothetical protein [unclassified Streptomyces]MCX5407478.1 hypothetical protein [Streptomyces sp. NBC_00086]
MTGLALEVDGWPPEPCDIAIPAPPVRTGHGNPCANVPTGEDRDVDTVIIKGELL